MNPLTAIRSMLNAMAEGQRVQAFGHGYQAKEDAQIAETAALQAREARAAALAPHELTRAEMEAQKAIFERKQRFEQARRKGYSLDEEGAAQAAADLANEERELELKRDNAQIEAYQSQTAATQGKLPGAEVPIGEELTRTLRGQRGMTGPPRPFTNAELEATERLRDDERMERQHRETVSAMRERSRASAAGRGGGGISTPQGLSFEAENVVRAVAGRMNKPAREEFFGNINRLSNAAANGVPGAEDEMKRMVRLRAVETEPVGEQAKINAREELQVALDDAETIMSEMEAKGVPTGWLQGTTQDLLRRVGKTNDPDITALGVRLDDALVRYRHAMTGAAFNEIEDRQYRAMLPTYRNEYTLNMAVIRGMRGSTESMNRAYWERKLGPGGALFAGAVEPPPAAQGGGTRNPEARLGSSENPDDTPIEDRGGLAPRPNMKLLRNKRTGEYKWVDK